MHFQILILLIVTQVKLYAAKFEDLPLGAISHTFKFLSPNDICATMFSSAKIHNAYKELGNKQEYEACIALRVFGSINHAIFHVSRRCGINTIYGMVELFGSSITPNMYYGGALGASQTDDDRCLELFKYYATNHNVVMDLRMLNDAINAGAIKTVEFILEQGINTYSQVDPYSYSSWSDNDCKRTPLLSAIMAINNELFDIIFMNYNNDGDSNELRVGLVCSAKANNIHSNSEILNRLASQNSETSTTMYYEWQAACEHDSNEIMNGLLSRNGFQLITEDGFSCLIRKNRLDIIRLFLTQEHPIYRLSIDAQVPVALEKSSPDSPNMLCTLLLKAETANGKMKKYTSWSTLASGNGKLEMLKIFTQKTAQLKCLKENAIPGAKKTATIIKAEQYSDLMSAAIKNGMLNVVTYLMEDLNAQFDPTQSIVACESLNVDLLQYLKDKDALDLNGISADLFLKPVDDPRANQIGEGSQALKRIKVGLFLAKNGIDFQFDIGAQAWIRTGDAWLYSQLLQKVPHQSFMAYFTNDEKMLDNTMFESCRWGVIEVVQKFAPLNKYLDRCMTIAVSMNHLDLLQRLYMLPLSFNRFDAFVNSVALRNIEATGIFLNDIRPIVSGTMYVTTVSLSGLLNEYIYGNNDLAFKTVKELAKYIYFDKQMLLTIAYFADVLFSAQKLKEAGSNVALNGIDMIEALVSKGKIASLKLMLNEVIIPKEPSIVEFYHPNGQTTTMQVDHLTTLLSIACLSGYLEMVKFLIDEPRLFAGILRDTGFQALQYTLITKSMHIAMYLFSRDINKVYANKQVIKLFAEHWYPEIIKGYVEAYKLSQSHNLLEDIFILAVRKGSVEIVQFCISKGVNVNMRKGDALIFAVSDRNEEMVKYLLTVPSIKVDERDGLALRTAATADDGNMMEILMNAGADPTLVDEEAIDLVCDRGNYPDILARMCREAKKRKTPSTGFTGGKIRPKVPRAQSPRLEDFELQMVNLDDLHT